MSGAHCYEDVVEHLLDGGLSICPRSSAGVVLTGSTACVVAAGSWVLAGNLWPPVRSFLSPAVPQSRGAVRGRV